MPENATESPLPSARGSRGVEVAEGGERGAPGLPDTPTSGLLPIGAETSSHLAEVWGHMPKLQGKRLAWLASVVPSHLAIVEVGSLRGRSVCFLAAGVRHRAEKEGREPWAIPRIFAIDLWRATRIEQDRKAAAHNLERFEHNIAPINALGGIIRVEAHSHEAAKLWSRPIGLLHIDGGHSRQAIEGDYLGFAGFVEPGFWLAVHDYGGGFDGVTRYCDEVILPDRRWTEASLCGSLLTMRRRRLVEE